MGFRYRKSIRLGGGFRINISGSGIGYSWGVPGYRITKTANGKIRQTASIPGTGLSYSTEESLHKSARRNTAKESPYIDTEVIQSVDRENYKDSDFKALMKKIRRTRFLNKASLIIGFIGLLAFIVLHTPQRLFLTIFSFAVFFYVHYVAPVKLEYDFTDEQRAAYEEWYTAWRKLFACDTVYYVPETYTNSNAREHGGAEKTISEEKVLGMPNLPYYLRTNVPVFSVALNQRESFYIFPDKIFYIALNKELTRCTQLTYLPDIRVHDLRHSHVSLCIELGYSIVLVAKRIGDTVPVVMRTYAHLYPNKQQELVSKLEAIGSPTSNNDDSDLMSLG